MMKKNTPNKETSASGLRHLIKYAVLSIIFLFGLMSILATSAPKTVDKPASELDVSITVLDNFEHPSDNKLAVVVQFFFDGKYVNLRSNANISCNGVSLSKESLGYMARIPLVSQGGSYNFVHTRNGVTTSAALTVPQRPVFISPTEGATVTRSGNVTITYIAGSGSEVVGRAHGHRAGAGSISVEAGSQVDNGTYSGLNVISGGAGAFEAGPGSLSLTRTFMNMHSGGAGFESVKSKYHSGSKINITWL